MKFLKYCSSTLLLLYAESTTDVILDVIGKKAKGPILVKYCFASKFLVFLPLLITYFVGPIGIFIYWLIRIFFAKKIVLFD